MSNVRVRRPWDDSFKFDKEPGRGPRITEQAGYIPVDVQVKNMILAGQRLGEYRREAYDFEPDVDVPDDVDVDPTRSPNFDLADGTQAGLRTRLRLAEQGKAAAEKRKLADVSGQKDVSGDKKEGA